MTNSSNFDSGTVILVDDEMYYDCLNMFRKFGPVMALNEMQSRKPGEQHCILYQSFAICPSSES